KVGVFVDCIIQDMIQKAEQFNLDYIQLHGAEDVDTAKELYLQGFKVIKVFHIENELEHQKMVDFTPFCNYFLFDTKGVNEGGNGIKFNWSLLDNYQLSIPFLLSGGIAPDDVEFIKAIQHPFFAGVDINSRFETKPGLKNITGLKIFIDEIRNKPV
ncbi:MAG: phosphoribosylanthranilate isomerase, partial [Saprospiraceae bacterium]